MMTIDDLSDEKKALIKLIMSATSLKMSKERTDELGKIAAEAIITIGSAFSEHHVNLGEGIMLTQFININMTINALDEFARKLKQKEDESGSKQETR